MKSPGSRGKEKGGEVVHVEPRSLEMVNSDPAIRVEFERTRCISFCEKVQTHAHHFQLASMFSLNFKGDKVKIGDLEFIVSEGTISQATEIHLQGESWLKGKELDAYYFKEFVKPQYKDKYETTFARSYLLNHYNQLPKGNTKIFYM